MNVKCSMISFIVRTRFSGQDLLNVLLVFVFNVIQIRVLRGSPEIKEPSPLKTRSQRKRKIEDTGSGNEQNIHDHDVSLTKSFNTVFWKTDRFFYLQKTHVVLLLNQFHCQDYFNNCGSNSY